MVEIILSLAALIIVLNMVDCFIDFKSLQLKRDSGKRNVAYKSMQIENIALKRQVATMEKRLEFLEYMDRTSRNKAEVPPEIAEILKYARKRAHPDAGGRQEDFVRMNCLYKKYVKR